MHDGDQSRFTRRHGVGIFCGAALGILMLNLLQAFGLLNIWTAIVVVIVAIEQACFIGAPTFTKKVHREVAAWLLTPQRPYQAYIGLVGALMLASSLMGLNIVAGDTPGLFDAMILQTDATHDQLFVMRIIGMVFACIAMVLTYALSLHELKSGTLKVLITALMILTLSLIFSGIGFVCVWALAILMVIVTPIFVMAWGVYLLLVTLRLAGSQETASIAVGTLFGVGIGALLGWTDMHPLLTAQNMAIGASAGCTFGWVYSRFGGWISSTSPFRKTESFMKTYFIPEHLH